VISPLPSIVKGDAGVSGVGLLVQVQLGWLFRPQLNADVGIDAQIETVFNGVPTGRLLGVQIKAGSSFFEEQTPDGDGWVFREGTQRHRRYWLRYRLPVILVLYDIDGHAAYWQLITEDTAVVTGSGFKVIVPRSQRLDSGAAEALAALARQAAPDLLGEQLIGLPAACASSLAALAESAPDLAQELAEALIEGRDEPGVAARRLADGSAAGWPWLAWSALAEFAGEYGLDLLAAEYLLRAEEQCDDASAAGRLKAYAGLYLSAQEPQRARRLFTDASVLPGAALVAAVGLAALDHGDREGPTPLPAALAEQPAQTAADATIQRFLADQAARGGDVEAAIGFHEKALELVPRSAKQMLALAEALLRRPRPGPDTPYLADYRRAASLAAEARAARRRCKADSVPAAMILLHALNLSGDERSAIRVATPAPDGDATDAEAASPALAFYAARLCYEIGDIAAGDRFADTIAAAGDPEWITHCAAAKASTSGADKTEQIRRWQDFLDTDAPDDHRLVALNNLAQLGEWPLPDLERLHRTGHLTDGTYDTLHAQALVADGQHEAAFRLLRQGASTNVITAESYARLLAEQGHIDDSIEVCNDSTLRTGDPRLDLLALNILTHANRIDEVITRAGDLLSRDDLPFNLRHRVRSKLIEVHGRRQDWSKCERLARDGLAEVRRLTPTDTRSPGTAPGVFTPALTDLQARRSGYSWVIIISQYQRNQIDEAFTTLTTLGPSPVTPVHVAVWAALHQAHGWTTTTAEQALSLAVQDDLPPVVAGPLLLSLLRSCQIPPIPTGDTGDASTVSSTLAVPVDEGFRQRLGDAWTAFLRRHPAGVVRSFSSSDEQLAEQLREFLLPWAVGYDQALQKVRAGQLPLGALSATASKPYLLSLVQNAAGMICAVTPVLEIHEQELNAAREALGGTIAIEGSALYVACSTNSLWPTAKNLFRKILLAEAAAQDIARSHMEARNSANTVGTVGADPRSRELVITAVDDTVRMLELDDTARVLRASEECRSTPVAEPGPFATMSRAEIASPWLGPVAVALQRDVALYSDDAYLRSLANSCGVRAFGSLALTQVLLEREHIDVEEFDTVIGDLFRNNVVDLPNIGPLLADTARAQRSTAQPILTNLTRPTFWQDIGAGHLVTVIAFLARHVDCQPQALGALTRAMADGLVATFGPPEQLLGMLGTIVILQATDLSAESAEPVLRAIREIATGRDLEPISALRLCLIEALTDPDDRFGMSAQDAEQTVDRILATTTPSQPL
jgi:hypothetical protein